MGLNIARIHQHLSEFSTGGEEGDGSTTELAFDLGYYRRQLVLSGLDMGISIRNMGPQIARSQERQADPRPIKFIFGFKWSIIAQESYGIALFYDLNKLLVASHPNVDFDGDGYIGGYDSHGNPLQGGEYSRDGEREVAHTDPWYRALITSWYDDWLYGGDVDRDGNGAIDADEVGNQDEGSFKDEMRTITPHTGVELRFLTYYLVRAGMIHDKIGQTRDYTFGAGIHFGSFRLDVAHVPGWGLSTGKRMLFSMNLAF
jgi:hypothetical protein